MHKLNRSKNKCTCQVACVRKVQASTMGLNKIKIYIMCMYEEVTIKPIIIYNSYINAK